MDLITLNQNLLALEQHAADLGFGRSNAEFHLNWIGEGPRINLKVFVAPDPHQTYPDHEFARGGFQSSLTINEIEETMHEAYEWLFSLETPEQTRRRKFTEDLAHLVEEGRALGSPILADLEATMKRLSENILEFSAA